MALNLPSSPRLQTDVKSGLKDVEDALCLGILSHPICILDISMYIDRPQAAMKAPTRHIQHDQTWKCLRAAGSSKQAQEVV